MRDRGDRLLDQCRRSRDLCRRSRDLDRSLGLYRDVCDLSLNLDCHSLLDRDCHCSLRRSRLLEYILRVQNTARQRPTRINGRAGGDLRSRENPYREPRTRSGSAREQYNRTL